MKKDFCIYILAAAGLLLMLSPAYSQESSIGKVTDYDGNVYSTVTIGTQIWMVENLRTTHYRNGEPIPVVSENIQWGSLTTGAYCNFNNDEEYIKSYGRIYNWYAATDKLNICPAGWHVPSTNEWKKLEANLGGVGMAGGKMKEAGVAHWVSPNVKADNNSGFTALPGGSRNTDGTFEAIGESGHWWTSNEFSVNSAWHRSLYNNTAFIDNIYGYKTDGYSIRCIKDN